MPDLTSSKNIYKSRKIGETCRVYLIFFLYNKQMMAEIAEALNLQ